MTSTTQQRMYVAAIIAVALLLAGAGILSARATADREVAFDAAPQSGVTTTDATEESADEPADPTDQDTEDGQGAAPGGSDADAAGGSGSTTDAPTAASPSPPDEPAAQRTAESPFADPEGPSAPVRVVIPAIDVDSEVVAVGLLDDGAMETPDFGLTGWYQKGPVPGQTGPAVLAAHVSSSRGPDVFARLSELEPDDEVHVVRRDGKVTTWVTRGSEQTPKEELPVERIWGWTDEPTLRLITCGGTFDRAARSHTDNVTVYLELQA